MVRLYSASLGLRTNNYAVCAQPVSVCFWFGGGLHSCAGVCRNACPEPKRFRLYDVLNSRVLLNGSEMSVSIYGTVVYPEPFGSASTTYSMLRLHSVHPASDSGRTIGILMGIDV